MRILPTTIGAATIAVAAILTSTACGHQQVAKVVRTDGSSVIGALVTTHPDAITIAPPAGTPIVIARATIASIDTPSPTEMATLVAHGGMTGGGAPGGGKGGGPGGGTGGGGTGGEKPPSDTPPNGDPSTIDPRKGGGSPTDPTRQDPAHPDSTRTDPTRSDPTRTDPSRSDPSRINPPQTDPSKVDPFRSDPTHANPSELPPSGGATAGGVIVPSGTALSLSLNAPLDSNGSREETPIEAIVTAPVLVNGRTLLHAGTRVRGVVLEATSSAAAEGRGRLTIRFHTLVIGDRELPIQSAPVSWQASGLTRGDAKKVGLGAALGAGLGRIVSGTKKGLGLGAAAGAASTAIVVSRRKDVHLAQGAVVRIRLSQSLSIPLR